MRACVRAVGAWLCDGLHLTLVSGFCCAGDQRARRHQPANAVGPAIVGGGAEIPAAEATASYYAGSRPGGGCQGGVGGGSRRRAGLSGGDKGDEDSRCMRMCRPGGAQAGQAAAIQTTVPPIAARQMNVSLSVFSVSAISSTATADEAIRSLHGPGPGVTARRSFGFVGRWQNFRFRFSTFETEARSPNCNSACAADHSGPIACGSHRRSLKLSQSLGGQSPTPAGKSKMLSAAPGVLTARCTPSRDPQRARFAARNRRVAVVKVRRRTWLDSMVAFSRLESVL